MYEIISDEETTFGRMHIKYQDKYYIVSRANTFDRGDETMIFAADEDGEVTSYLDLYAGYGESRTYAVENWISEL